MTDAPVSAPLPSRTLLAAGLVVVYAFIVGFTDNFVRQIAEDTGLWQFHATRTAMAIVLLAIAAQVTGASLWPRNPRAVLARSLIHGTAMVIYFGCLAFLPVAEAAAGLFTAPIFVLLLSRFVWGQRIGPFRILAVAIGFAGVLLVLGLGTGAPLGPAMILPIAAGGLYALGNLATTRWCGEESAETLLAGFFLALGVFGLIGMAVLAVWQPDAAQGTAGFLSRGVVWPTGRFLFWTFVQAAGSLVAVGMMVRAYQIADASRVAVFEYVILPMSAMWSFVLWGQRLTPTAMVGIVLIIAAGMIIAARANR